MKLKRILSVSLVLCMILGVLPVVSSADDVGSWSELQTAISAGGAITLSEDVTASAGEGALTVPANVTVTLDLNGHTIDRALEAETTNGSVIVVNGTLTVTDTSAAQTGSITGGNTTGTGGGVRVKSGGIFTLAGGSIEGNHAKNSGGGVYLSGSGARFTLAGGSIENNTSKNGAGVAEDGAGYLTIQSGTITANAATNNGGGVWFGGGSGSGFSMTGGSITANTAAVKGGGVYINGGSFAPEGGSITGNTAPTYPDIGTKNSASVRTYDVTVSGSITNGTVTADKASARYGEIVTLTATPASDDYVLRSMSVTDSDGGDVSVTDNSFVMPAKSVTVSASFDQRRSYSVEVDYDIENGRLEVNGSISDYVYEGDTVIAVAYPDSHRVAASWTVLMRDEFTNEYTRPVPGVVRTDPNTISFPMPSERVKISAEFGGENGPIAFAPYTAGGTVIADKPLFDRYGDTVTLTITPDNGYNYVPGTLRVVEVDEDFNEINDLTDTFRVEELEENSEYAVMTDSYSIFVYADFVKAPEMPKYYIAVDGETENGTISSELVLAEAGWTVRLTASPDSYRGYVTRSVTVTDANGTVYPVTDLGYNSYSFTMPSADVFVTAEFGLPSFGITVSNPTYASMECEVEVDEEAETGDSVNVYLVVRPEKELVSLTVTGDDTGAAYPATLAYHNEGGASYYYRFTMPSEPVTVAALFDLIRYPITVDGAVEGSVLFSLNGGEYVSSPSAVPGDAVSVRYTYVNAEGTQPEHVDKLTYSYTLPSGDGVTTPLRDQMQNGSEYTGTFTMPESNVVIGAVYEAPFAITVDDAHLAAQGGGAHASASRANEGDEITLYSYSDDGYPVKAAWSVTYTDGEGTHRIALTRISDSSSKFTMPAADVSVSADIVPWGAYFINRTWNGESVVSATRGIPDYTPAASVSGAALSGGWYFINENTTWSERVTVSGTVRLVLADGVVLRCEEGICVPSGATLRVYGQTNDSGTLIATADSYDAAIGGNDEASCGTIEFYGGTVNATGGTDSAGIGGANEVACGNVTVYGGSVTAQGGTFGAGIGSGDDATEDAGTVTIYNGTVNATGGDEAAGIGGGNENDSDSRPVSIVIRGGIVNATGRDYAAGIGGGDDGKGGDVTISGGTVTATGGENAPGIGGGESKDCGTVLISGGTVTANGGDDGAGIGCGMGVNSTASITISGGTVYANGYGRGAGIGCSEHNGTTGGGGDFGGTILISGGTVVAKALGYSHSTGSSAGHGPSQPSQTNSRSGAAIGSAVWGDMTGTIRITGGDVTAEVCSVLEEGGAPIGGGVDGSCPGTVEITGGSVFLKKSSETRSHLIGCGTYGGSNYGTLILGPGYCVLKESGSDFVPVAASERASVLHNTKSPSVKIVPCEHPAHTYTHNDETHTQTCRYCASTFSTEPHVFEDGLCICGALTAGECTVSMGAAADSAKTRADLYFTLPDGVDPADFTVTVNGETTSLGEMTLDENGYKFSITVPAKNMGDKIAYSLDSKGITVKYGEVSVADYAEHLATYYPEYAEFVDAMLTYGAAAQNYFGYDTEHMVSDADLSALPAVAGTRFDARSLQTPMHADDTIPVFYNAMNVTFLADTTLSLAFKIKDGYDNTTALEWVNANVTLGDAAVTGRISVNTTNDYRFVIISKQNIALDAITEPMALIVSGAGTYSVSVINYLAAAEQTDNNNLKYLTRALYAYSQAAIAIAGN